MKRILFLVVTGLFAASVAEARVKLVALPERARVVVSLGHPDATLVDITHEVPAHDILDGALQLAAAARYFPAGTIFLAVVDPGVGSARRGIAAEAGDYRFVAPDNGVLTAVLREWAPKKIVELTDRRYARRRHTGAKPGRFVKGPGWQGPQ